MKTSLKGAVIASAVASMFAAGAALAADKTPAKAASKNVKCLGGNGCSGKSACATDKNACAGMNGCKGKGWTMVDSEKACTAAGGKIAATETDKK